MTDLATTERPRRDLTKEYVTGGPLLWYSSRQRLLPAYIDDLTAELGDDLYERMENDPMVRACLGVIKTGILEESVTLVPAIDDDTADGYQQSADLVDWCQAILDDLTIPLDDVLWDMLSCMAYGVRVAEQKYEIERTYTGQEQVVLCALKPKPRAAIGFAVDPYLNVLGLVGRRGGETSLLERDRFAVLTFRPKDSDPRGTTILRASYNAWDLKMRTWPEYLRYLVQFASPSIDGEVAPGAPDELEYNDAGDATGVTLTAEQAFLQKLLVFRNGSVIARPSGSKLTMLWSQGEGKAFLEAFRLFNREIATGIVYQTRALMEAEFGSKADSSTANDILTTLIRQLKRSVCRMLRTDVLRLLVRYNYGPEAEPLTPYASLGETEQQDWAGMMSAASQAGYTLDPSQFPGIDELLNLPPRDPEAAAPSEPDDADQDAQPQQPPEDAQQGEPGQPADESEDDDVQE